MKTCKVDDCGRPLWALSLCQAHYNRWHTYGDLNLNTNGHGRWPDPAPWPKDRVTLPVRHAGPYCRTCGMAEGHWLGCAA